MFQIFPSLKKVKVGSPRHFLSNNVRPTVPIFCKSFFGSKPATKLLKPVILFATFYMSRTVWGMIYTIHFQSMDRMTMLSFNLDSSAALTAWWRCEIFWKRANLMPDNLHRNAFWEISLHIFKVSVCRTTSQVLKGKKMVEGTHLVLNSVLLVYKGSSQQGFPLLVRLFWGITFLHRHCQLPGSCGCKPTEALQNRWLMGPQFNVNLLEQLIRCQARAGRGESPISTQLDKVKST